MEGTVKKDFKLFFGGPAAESQVLFRSLVKGQILTFESLPIPNGGVIQMYTVEGFPDVEISAGILQEFIAEFT